MRNSGDSGWQQVCERLMTGNVTDHEVLSDVCIRTRGLYGGQDDIPPHRRRQQAPGSKVADAVKLDRACAVCVIEHIRPDEGVPGHVGKTGNKAVQVLPFRHVMTTLSGHDGDFPGVIDFHSPAASTDCPPKKLE